MTTRGMIPSMSPACGTPALPSRVDARDNGDFTGERRALDRLVRTGQRVRHGKPQASESFDGKGGAGLAPSRHDVHGLRAPEPREKSRRDVDGTRNAFSAYRDCGGLSFLEASAGYPAAIHRLLPFHEGPAGRPSAVFGQGTQVLIASAQDQQAQQYRFKMEFVHSSNGIRSPGILRFAGVFHRPNTSDSLGEPPVVVNLYVPVRDRIKCLT